MEPVFITKNLYLFLEQENVALKISWRCNMENVEPGYWQTKDGRILKITDMEDEHIVSTIRLLKRVVREMRFSRDLAGLSVLNFVQGEMAQYAIESDLELDARLNDEEWLERHTAYRELVGEAKRRGILEYIGSIIFSNGDHMSVKSLYGGDEKSDGLGYRE